MDARAKPGCGSAFSQGLLQFRILMWKNIILARRNWKSSLAQIFSPVIVVLLLLGMSARSLSVFPFGQTPYLSMRSYRACCHLKYYIGYEAPVCPICTLSICHWVVARGRGETL
jgi:hypothetical protein